MEQVTGSLISYLSFVEVVRSRAIDIVGGMWLGPRSCLPWEAVRDVGRVCIPGKVIFRIGQPGQINHVISTVAKGSRSIPAAN